MEDEIDGLLASFFIDSVKSAVLHLLNIVIRKYQRDYCNSCLTDRLSGRSDGDAAERVHTCFAKKLLSKFNIALKKNIDIVSTVTLGILLKVEAASRCFSIPAKKLFLLAQAHVLYGVTIWVRVRASVTEML